MRAIGRIVGVTLAVSVTGLTLPCAAQIPAVFEYETIRVAPNVHMFSCL